MAKPKDIRDRSKKMIERDQPRLDMQNAMLKMWRMESTLDPKLAELPWIRDEVSSDPHDAVRAGVRVFSSLKPMVTLTPLLPTKANRDRTDELERGLMWELDLAFKRRGRPLAEILKQALLFDQVCVQVSHVGNQKKAMKSFGSKMRGRNAERFGKFIVTPRNPLGVFADFSDFGLERVLYRNVLPLHEVVSFWGEKAKKLEKEAKDKKNKNGDYVTVYDYHDFETRYVFAYLQTSETEMAEITDKGAITLLKEDNKLDFLPWVIKQGGDELIPLLYSVEKSGQYEDQNMLLTMVMSEAISMFAGPRYKYSGIGEPEIDYAEPGRFAKVPPGGDLEALAPPGLDENLLELMARVKQMISKSTVSEVVSGGPVASGTAFATLDLQSRSAVKAFSPYRDLAQDAVAEIFRLMIYWIDHTDDTIYTYPVISQKVSDIEDVGGEVPPEFAGQLDATISAPKEIDITKEDFDIDHLYIEVELKEDVATDRLQRTNAAIMQRKELDVPLATVLPELGHNDPGHLIEINEQEKDQALDRELQRFEKQAGVQRAEEIKTMKAQGMVQLQLQDQAMAAQQQQQEQQLQQQQAEQQAIQQQQQDQAEQGDLFRASGPGVEAAQGPGFDPSKGGTPPGAAFPAGTNQQQTQRAGTVATQATEGGA